MRTIGRNAIPQPMGTTRRAVPHTCERSTAPGLSCAALLRVQTQGSEYVPVVCCQVYTACSVIGCSGCSGACCRQQTALWSQGHPPCARTHQAAQHREVPDELAVVEPVRGRNVLEHLCECVLHDFILSRSAIRILRMGQPRGTLYIIILRMGQPRGTFAPVESGRIRC